MAYFLKYCCQRKVVKSVDILLIIHLIMFEVPKLQNQTDIQSGLQLKAAQILK